GGGSGLSPNGGTGSRDRGTAAYTGGPLDLRMRGSLPTTPLLRVDDPGLYGLWRSGIYARYTGASVWLPAVQPRSINLPATGAVTSPDAPVVTFVVHRLTTGDTAVYAPGDVKTLAADVADVAGGVAIDNGNGTMLLDRAVSTYTVGAALVPTVGEATAPLGAPADSSAWTQLPVTVPARVRQLSATLAGGVNDPRDAVRAIESYLRANEKYTLDSPVPGPNEDAVDVFLFRDHVGFCEQFASAETVLLRAAGIPSRLVTGLADGTDNGAGGRDFTAAQLHAWVEFWVPGTGWVSSDPTAGTALATGTSASTAIHRAVTALLARIPYGRFGVAAILLVVAVGVAVLVMRRRRRRPLLPAAGGSAVAYGPATDAYRRLQRRLAARGQARWPQETVRDHAARIGADPALIEALTVVEDEVFAAHGPPPERSAQAAAYLDARSPVATAPRRRVRFSPRR
ncbi:MAG: protein-glutamine gamma-glutamyltransferase, partial [Frankiaceae bacterium]|nr:protein-glutamine gamma-glutamyltransferase [Frankiaceae bacterium]